MPKVGWQMLPEQFALIEDASVTYGPVRRVTYLPKPELHGLLYGWCLVCDESYVLQQTRTQGFFEEMVASAWAASVLLLHFHTRLLSFTIHVRVS
jgi:hypothetical protein